MFGGMKAKRRVLRGCSASRLSPLGMRNMVNGAGKVNEKKVRMLFSGTSFSPLRALSLVDGYCERITTNKTK